MFIKNCPGCISEHFVSFGRAYYSQDLSNEMYSIQKCINCGLYFKDNILGESELEEVYNTYDFNVLTPDKEYVTEKIIRDYLKQYDNLTILDYGCSDGRFISQFTQQHDCYGYDIDLRALKLAALKGVKILEENTLNQVGEFDVIILSDVFEHSLHPTELIKDLFKLLKKDGVLIVSTGYADAKACQFDLPNYWYFKLEQHICMMGNDYVNYLQNYEQIQILKRMHCSHYQVNLAKRVFYSIRFHLFKYVHKNPRNFFVNLMRLTPGIKKVTKWKDQPYYPYSKDHIVLFLQKNV